MIETNIISHLTREELFGSQTGLARALGCTAHTICEKLSKRRPLTYEQMCRVLVVARERGFPITPDDFFRDLDLSEKPKRRRAA